MAKDTHKETVRESQAAQPAASTEQVVVTGRPLEKPVEQTRMGSTREVHDKQRKALEEGRAQMRDAPLAEVDHANAKIVPNIGQGRAQTSEELRQEKEEGAGSGKVAQAAPYPGDPHEAQVKAILASERQAIGTEFRTDDLTGTSVDGAGETDVVKVRLLFDWWDGQGVRHPANSLVEVAMNDARNLVDQRKAERTDPLR